MSDPTYADLPSLKDWLGIEGDDTHYNRDDYALSTALIAASRAIDNWCNRRFYLDTEVTARFVVPYTGQTLFVPDIGDATDLTITVDTDYSGNYDTEITAYRLTPDVPPYRRISVRNITLRDSYTVKIEALFGFPEVPAAIEQATLMLAARYFKRHLSPEGVAGVNDFGVVRISTKDSDVAALLAPYRIHGWA